MLEKAPVSFDARRRVEPLCPDCGESGKGRFDDTHARLLPSSDLPDSVVLPMEARVSPVDGCCWSRQSAATVLVVWRMENPGFFEIVGAGALLQLALFDILRGLDKTPEGGLRVAGSGFDMGGLPHQKDSVSDQSDCIVLLGAVAQITAADLS